MQLSEAEQVRRITIQERLRLVRQSRGRTVPRMNFYREWSDRGGWERAAVPPDGERCLATEDGIQCIRRRAGRKYCAEHRIPMRRARQRERYTGAVRRRIQRQARAASREQAALKRRWNAMLEASGGERLSELEWRELLRWRGRAFVRDVLKDEG